MAKAHFDGKLLDRTRSGLRSQHHHLEKLDEWLINKEMRPVSKEYGDLKNHQVEHEAFEFQEAELLGATLHEAWNLQSLVSSLIESHTAFLKDELDTLDRVITESGV